MLQATLIPAQKLHPEGSWCAQCQQAKAQVGETRVRFCLDCGGPMFLIAGRYQLQSKIAEGGGGQVFSARDTHHPEQPLRVLKFLTRAKRDKEMYRRFAREISLAIRLSEKTRHIVKAHPDFGYIPELGAFFVMEFVQGQNLSDWLKYRRDEPLSVAVALSMFMQILEVIEAIHQEGVIHRDIKPHNIMVVHSYHALPMLKLTDFGAARQLEGMTLTHTTDALIGTPMYMPPEQFMCSKVDERADVYALGLILYELLAGEHPFQRAISHGGTGKMLLDASVVHLYQQPPSLRALRPELPKGLEELILWALQKDPEKRLPSVGLFIEKLRQIDAVPKASTRAARVAHRPLPQTSLELQMAAYPLRSSGSSGELSAPPHKAPLAETYILQKSELPAPAARPEETPAQALAAPQLAQPAQALESPLATTSLLLLSIALLAVLLLLLLS